MTLLLFLTACIDYDLRPGPTATLTPTYEITGLDAPPALPEDAVGTIGGLICDPTTGQGLPGVRVQIYLSERDTRTDLTDRDGHFAFPELPPGVHIVVSDRGGTWSAWVTPRARTTLDSCSPGEVLASHREVEDRWF